MNRVLCLAFVMSASLLTGAGPAMAGMNEGVAAITVGDYARAISEFEPLAASGDAAAQYQLAKLYLEGHGPADGVPRGVDLMTKAATANHPEAQAQLGLMYAMGLGVPVDNAQAYAWLSKAVDALPDGTRRAVAEANRDAVQKRMKPDQPNVVASAAAASTAAPASAPATKPTTTTGAAPAVKPATTEAAPAAKPATTEATAAKTAPTPPPAKPAPAAAATAKPAAVEPKPAETTAAAKPAMPAKPTASEPVEVAAAKPATQGASAPAATVTEASNVKPAKTPETSTQVASAKAPEPASEPATATLKASGPASAEAVQSGARIQIASLPSEEAAWQEWERLSGQFSTQLSGLTAIVRPADLGEQGTFYRIQTGPFDSVAAAEQRCATMKEAGLGCLVISAK